MSYLSPIEQKEVNDALQSVEQYQQLKQDPIIGKTFFKKYKATNKIAEGAFGVIYEGINLNTKEQIAIKLEDQSQYNILEKEAYILYNIKGFGIVDIISFGRNKKYNIMIQPLLGNSLYQIYLNCKKQFTLKDICLIGLECLKRIKWIHNKNFIHRDIKPENFLVGKKDPRIIYIIDFGLSKKYRSERTMKHIQFCLTKKLTGTARYASVNALKGFELSRRDDLESFCYMILFFLLKKLPWQGIKAQTQAKRYKKICDLKEMFDIDNYKKIIPFEIIKIFKQVKKLKFDENPDYYEMIDSFEHLLKKLNYKENETFSWIVDPRILNLKKSVDIYQRKKSYKRRILTNIEKNINLKKHSPELLHKNKSCNKIETHQSLDSAIINLKNVSINQSEMLNSTNIKDSINYQPNNESIKKIDINNSNNNNEQITSRSRKACLEYNLDEDEKRKIYNFNEKQYKEYKDKIKINNYNNNNKKLINTSHNNLNFNKKLAYGDNFLEKSHKLTNSYNVLATNDTTDRNFILDKIKLNPYLQNFQMNSFDFYNNKKNITNELNKTNNKKNSQINRINVYNKNNDFYLNRFTKKKINKNFMYRIDSFNNKLVEYTRFVDRKKSFNK